MLPSSGARRSIPQVAPTGARVVSSPYLRKLAHRLELQALPTRLSSATLLTYLAAAGSLPTGAGLSTLVVAGAARLGSHDVRLGSHDALLTCLAFAALLPS